MLLIIIFSHSIQSYLDSVVRRIKGKRKAVKFICAPSAEKKTEVGKGVLFFVNVNVEPFRFEKKQS